MLVSASLGVATSSATTTQSRRARLIAMHLPQFHPIRENDEWWGAGFTEWTNVTKAKPLFRGHKQPNLPADLGFYDLRVPEVREAQAALARRYGIEAFCYYHYWFAGKQLLERPVKEIVASGEPDFPFCLCWANGTWTGIWHGAPDRVLIEQTYPGAKDNEAHFRTVLPALRDRRYLTVEGKPLFMIYLPRQMPPVRAFIDQWRELARREGLAGLFFVGLGPPPPRWDATADGFDGSVSPYVPVVRPWTSWRQPFKKLRVSARRWRGLPTIYEYAEEVAKFYPDPFPQGNHFPVVLSNWDNTPRAGQNGSVLRGSTPELFRGALRKAIELVQAKSPEQRIVIIKSWNEWAEGNYLEPDKVFGHGWLEAVATEVLRVHP